MIGEPARQCETCGREGLRLKPVKPSGLLDDADEERWLCTRDRVFRRILIIGAWVFQFLQWA